VANVQNIRLKALHSFTQPFFLNLAVTHLAMVVISRGTASHHFLVKPLFLTINRKRRFSQSAFSNSFICISFKSFLSSITILLTYWFQATCQVLTSSSQDNYQSLR
jgi:hypothetical protein